MRRSPRDSIWRAIVPPAGVRAHASAVERISSIVGSQLVDLAVDGELRATDAVGVAANDGTEMGVVVEVTGKCVVAQYDVIAPTVPIAHRPQVFRRETLQYFRTPYAPSARTTTRDVPARTAS